MKEGMAPRKLAEEYIASRQAMARTKSEEERREAVVEVRCAVVVVVVDGDAGG